MDNPEKLAIYGTQDEENQKTKKHNTTCTRQTTRKQIQTTQTRHDPSYKQLLCFNSLELTG